MGDEYRNESVPNAAQEMTRWDDDFGKREGVFCRVFPFQLPHTFCAAALNEIFPIQSFIRFLHICFSAGMCTLTLNADRCREGWYAVRNNCFQILD